MVELHPFYEAHRGAMETATRQRLDLAEAALRERAPASNIDRIAAIVAALLMITLFATAVSEARGAKGIPLRISKDAFGFHLPVELSGKTIYGVSPDEHLVYFVEDALTQLELEPDILVLSASKLKNGFALMSKGSKGQMVRIILIDEDELEQFKKKTRSSAADRLNLAVTLLSLAHEIGHHVCGHLATEKFQPWQQELEADRVAGAILAKSPWIAYFTAKPGLEDFLAAGRKVLGTEAGSESHPPLARRLEAIQTGWSAGIGCRVQRIAPAEDNAIKKN